MHILHTVLYTFPKMLTRRICSTVKSFFSFFWLQYHWTKSSHMVSLVSLMSFVFEKFWHKRHNNNSLNQYFKLNIKVKLWLIISRISRRELDVSYLEQCYCNIYRNFKRYLVIDCFLDWIHNTLLYGLLVPTIVSYSFGKNACLKFGTHLLQILLRTLIYYITLNQN